MGIAVAALASLAMIPPSQAALPANGSYVLVNRASGKALDGYGLTANGSMVSQYDENIGAPQQWVLSTVGSNWKLKDNQTGLYIDSDGHTGNGSTCLQWASSGSVNQQWTIQDLGTGYYRIINVANGLCLDTGGSLTNGAPMQFWGSGGSFNQQWSFVPPGTIFFSARTFTGTKSQLFGVGSYTTAQMVAKGCADNSANSLLTWWPGYSTLTYDTANLTGTPVVFTENTPTMPGMAGIMSSVKVQAGYPAGVTYRSQPGNWVPFQVSFLFGTYDLMHNGDNVQLKSSGTSKYTVRYETEYWIKSGTVSPPIVTVISGANVLDHTSGSSLLGTCTGTAFPWEAYYTLTGEVKWTDNESAGGCAYNLGLRDGGW